MFGGGTNLFWFENFVLRPSDHMMGLVGKWKDYVSEVYDLKVDKSKHLGMLIGYKSKRLGMLIG